MATQQEREAFLRGWRAAMDEVIAALAQEAKEWKVEEAEASASGGYKLPGSFALNEVRGAFKGRRDLATWITQTGPAAGQNASGLGQALDALVEGRGTNAERTQLGLASVEPDDEQPSTDEQN